MILVDFSNVIISNVMVSFKHNNDKILVDENLIRHLVLNSLRVFKTKHKQYGKLVLCLDYLTSWRKKKYAFYKANRKKIRDSSIHNWDEIFKVINIIIQELQETFSYKIIRIPHAEADDVIAVIANDTDEKTLIISADSDFIQLQTNSNIHQWCPIKKIYIKSKKTPIDHCREKIIRGDRADGIPSIISPNDIFITGGRQKPLKKDLVDKWKNDVQNSFLDESVITKRFVENFELINFDAIPKEIKADILKEYEKPIPNNGSNKIFSYFIKHKLKTLSEYIEQF